MITSIETPAPHTLVLKLNEPAGNVLVELGPTREVLHRPQQDCTQRLLDTEPTLDLIGRESDPS